MIAIRQAILARRLPAPRRGERAELRPHEPCDPAHTIDWYASAGRGSLYVRERARDKTVTWAAIVDESASMRVPAYDPPLAPAYEAQALWRDCTGACDTWLQIDCNTSLNLEDALHAALRQLPAQCALLYVSDFYDLPQIPRPLIALAGRRFDCTALVVRDRWQLPNGVLCAADAESRAVRRVYVGHGARARYVEAARERERTVCGVLRECGWRAAILDRDPGEALRRAFDQT